MKFTLAIASAILAFTPMHTVAIPLTNSNVHHPHLEVTPAGPLPFSIAPNGLMVPGAFETPTATAGLASAGPVDPETFPTIEEHAEPTETTKTGLPFDSHPDDLEDFPTIEATSPGPHRRHRPTRRPLIQEQMVGPESVLMHSNSMPTEHPHHYGHGAPNFHPWGHIGGHGPVTTHKPANYTGVHHLAPGHHTPMADHSAHGGPKLQTRHHRSKHNGSQPAVPKHKESTPTTADHACGRRKFFQLVWDTIWSPSSVCHHPHQMKPPAPSPTAIISNLTGGPILDNNTLSKRGVDLAKDAELKNVMEQMTTAELSSPEAIHAITHFFAATAANVTGTHHHVPLNKHNITENKHHSKHSRPSKSPLEVDMMIHLLNNPRAHLKNSTEMVQMRELLKQLEETLQEDSMLKDFGHVDAKERAAGKAHDDGGKVAKRGQDFSSKEEAFTEELNRLREHEILLQKNGAVKKNGSQQKCIGKEGEVCKQMLAYRKKHSA